MVRFLDLVKQWNRRADQGFRIVVADGHFTALLDKTRPMRVLQLKTKREMREMPGVTEEVYRSGDGAQDEVGLGGGVRAAAD